MSVWTSKPIRSGSKNYLQSELELLKKNRSSGGILKEKN